ncbi:YdeI/OmpD-associated family protein [Sphingomonas sp. PAMC 26621]|uniref:YdeI/OmpD-associated family protein n=1 Tax=Sphingomonas sp. PAMC 26621 TaxID=1112213 RepID=UPI00028A212C|nr:YdeI/OmpD-associated family protein [Sphingomonas sp. PAMC 26621]
MIPTERFEQVEVASLNELRLWLAANHERDEGVWLVRFKKNVAAKFINRLDVLDELLCYGWVDGIARKLEDARTMQLIFPRKQHAWAQSYKDRAARLELEGRIKEPGRAAIKRSQQLGQWNSYAPVDALLVPDDLRSALRADRGAEAFFDATAPSYRRNVLRWISQAKKPYTRARRIATTAERSGRGEKLPQM